MGIRHDRAFTDLFDLYKPHASMKDSDKHFIGKSYPTTATYSAVVGRLEPNNEVSQPTTAGRAQQDTRITEDMIRLLIDQTALDAWYAQLKTVGHPEYGTWYILMGMPQNMNWRAGTKTFYAKRTNKPPQRTINTLGDSIEV